VLAIKALLGLHAGQFDIETAFLYGELEEELWMSLPDGYDDYLQVRGINTSNKTHCLKLNKAIYGLVQAARQWWKRFTEVMDGLGFEPSKADPCLYVKKNLKSFDQSAFVIIYVDDGGIFGTKEEIKQIIEALRKEFKVKDLGPLENFVGCKISHSLTDKVKTLGITQPKLIKHLEEAFQNELKGVTRVYDTPAGPKTIIMRPEKGEPLISASDQTKYRSGVGMLLYLVKHSRPEISNAVRELSKVADGATQAHWKALIRAIKYVIDTKENGLFMTPKMGEDSFYLEGISDSEYAGDRDTRISVYGYVIYFCGAPIAWKSKSGKSVTLSSTEAEYFAMSEVVKEIMFVKQVIESMGIKLKYPIMVKVDNVGAIYLANNHTTGQRTKHIDIRRHFVREFVVDGKIQVVFVKSGDNDADILTKNTTEELFNKHTAKLVKMSNRKDVRN
jgi:hypothetical protein